jgi:hypothetical protein
MNGMNALGQIQESLSTIASAVRRQENRINELEGSGMGRIVPERAPEPAPQAVTEDWTVFVFNVALTVGQPTGTATNLVDATGHFDLFAITAVNSVDPSKTLPVYEFRIREGDQGKFLTSTSAFVDGRNMTGTAQRPYLLGGRRRFRANTTIAIEFSNITSAPVVDVEIQLCMHGIKVSV